MRTIMDEIMGVKTMLPSSDMSEQEIELHNEYKRGLIEGLERAHKLITKEVDNG